MNDQADVISNEIKASVAEIEQFLISALHKDYQAEIDIMIDMMSEKLNDYNLKMGGRQYDMIRGGKKMAEELREQFKVFLENKKHDNEREARVLEWKKQQEQGNQMGVNP